MGWFLMILQALLILLILIILQKLHQSRKRELFHKQHGIPTLGGFLSRTLRTLTGSLNLINFDLEIYREIEATNSKLVAYTDMFGQSGYYTTDLNLIQHVLVKDFDHFADLRPVNTKSCGKYFKKMLFTMQHAKWKGVRSKLSPAFTTGKIRKLFQIFKESSASLDTYLKKQLETGSGNLNSIELDFVKLFSKFSMDVIAKSAFGIDSQTWSMGVDEVSTFEKFAKRYGFKVSPKMILKFCLMLAAPKIADIFELEIFDGEAQNYLAEVVKGEVKTRRQTGTRKEDFLQLMMDAQQGFLKKDEESDAMGEGGEGDKINFTDEHLVANALLFFLGGFDTTQSVLLFAVYSLAREPEVQEKLLNEVTEVLCKHGNELTYEALSEMTYLDWIIHETMRIYPAVTRTERACTQDFTLPDTDFVIKKGSIVTMAIHGIHMDPKHYPNPEVFDPERFSPENKAGRHNCAFLGFSVGPRSCVGNRFAWIKIKCVLARLISSYCLGCSPKTKIPPEFDNSANCKPKGGMWLNVTARH